MKDMTVGKPAKVILLFSIPMLLSMAFQQMYNIADSVVAGKFAGEEALAAIGASYPVTMLFLAVALGAGVGSSVIVSQLYGIKKIGRMKTAIRTSILSIMALSLLLTAVGFGICKPVIKLLQTPSGIFDDANAYLLIYIAGLPLLFAYNAATSIFTALGDSRTPLYFLIFSSVFNVVLDIIFVTAAKWDVKGVVKGAAWATFIAQGVSGVLAMITLLFRVAKIECTEKVKWFDAKILKQICTVALPSILQQSFISVGQLCVQGLINSFATPTDTSVIAGYSAAIKINTFCVAIFNTMSNALSSFAAQNSGAGDYERVKQGYCAALGIVMAVAAVFIVLLLTAGKYMIAFFLDKGENTAQVIAVGQKFLRFVAIGYPVVAYLVVTNGLLRGAGFMLGFMSSTFTDLCVRVAVSFIFASACGFTSVCMSFPIGWTLGAVLSTVLYFSGKWKNKTKV